MTCIYRDPDHAVMCAISIGSVGIPKSANWQKDHGSGFDWGGDWDYPDGMHFQLKSFKK